MEETTVTETELREAVRVLCGALDMVARLDRNNAYTSSSMYGSNATSTSVHGAPDQAVMHHTVMGGPDAQATIARQALNHPAVQKVIG